MSNMYVVSSRRCKLLGTTPAAVPGVGAEGKDAGQASRCFGIYTTLYRAKQDHTLVLGEAGYYTASFAYTYQVMHENRWAKFAGIAFTRAELDVPNTGQTQTIKSECVVRFRFAGGPKRSLLIPCQSCLKPPHSPKLKRPVKIIKV